MNMYIHKYVCIYAYVYVYTAMTIYGNDDATPLAQGQDLRSLYIYMYIQKYAYIDRKKRRFPIYYVLSSRTVSKRTPLEEFVPGSSRGFLLLTVLDEGI